MTGVDPIEEGSKERRRAGKRKRESVGRAGGPGRCEVLSLVCGRGQSLAGS